MGTNANLAEQSPDKELKNRLAAIELQIANLKNFPQPIGNGSINYAYSVPDLQWSGVTVNPGDATTFDALFMPADTPLTYNNEPAYNRITLLDFLFTVYVDANDANHAWPYGSSLTAGQTRVLISAWSDFINSGISETNGQRQIFIMTRNDDTVAHTYYVTGNAIIPRPALKNT